VIFPTDLAKYVVALANSAGGIILIGIRANQTTNEPEEIVGIDLCEGLEEKVINICESNIKPRIIPEVKVCPFKSDENLPEEDKAVILIRVPESPIAPHIHTRRNEIWIRLHNRCALADLETIEHLLEKRDRASEILRNDLMRIEDIVRSARQRFTNEERQYLQAFTIFPLFPFKTIQFNRNVDDYLREQINRVRSFNQKVSHRSRIEVRKFDK